MKRRRLFSITIDLDPLRCYRQLFGLPSARDPSPDPVTTTAVDRFCELLYPLGVKGTLFVVGDTLAHPEASRRIEAAAGQGHEIANHTWSHPFNLSRLPAAQIDDEIARGADAVEQACGTRPAGFRAPGYLLGSEVLARLERTGARYDSSSLPCPAYQIAKGAAMGMLRALGRESLAVIGDPREALGPSIPFRPDPRRPWRQGDSKLVELPISTAALAPLTGALLALSGRRAAMLLARVAAMSPWINLELHAVDLLDITTDALDPALSAQTDLKIPWSRKAEIFRAFIERTMRTHRVVKLVEAVEILFYSSQFQVPSSKLLDRT